jgi:hypothetical protein
MIKRLIEMYENGSITGYQVMMDCLQMLDPKNPGLVLFDLPEEILDEMLKYAARYDPNRPHSASLPPPLKTRSGQPNAGYVPVVPGAPSPSIRNGRTASSTSRPWAWATLTPRSHPWRTIVKLL